MAYTSAPRKKPRPKAGVSAPKAVLPASTWSYAQGKPTKPQDYAPAQEYLLNQGYMLGDTGADGKWGGKSERAWTQNGIHQSINTDPSKIDLTGLPAAPAFQPSQAVAAELFDSSKTSFAGGTTPPDTTGKGSLLKRFGSTVGGAAGGLGTAIKNDPMAAVSAGLGVAGLIMNATTKSPEMPAQQDFNYAFRPARGMDGAAKSQAREQILSSTRAATMPTSANESLNASVRLEGARQAGTALAGLEVQDQQMLRQSQDRQEQMGYEQAKINYSGREQRKAQVYEALNRKAEARKAQGGAMVQGALTYAAQQSASSRQSAEYAAQGQNEQLNSEHSTLRGLLLGGNLNPAQQSQVMARIAEIQKMAATDTRTGSLGYQSKLQRTRPRRSQRSRDDEYDDTQYQAKGGVLHLASGGSVKNSVTVSTGGSRSTRSERMGKEFGQTQAGVTRQGMAHYSAVVRDLLRIKTQSVFSR